MNKLIYVLTAIFLTANIESIAARDIESDPQNWEKREHHYRSKDSFGSFEIYYKGKIVVNDDDKSIKSISPGGYLNISKASFGNERRLEIVADANGFTGKYFEGKKEVDFKNNGEKW